MAWACLHCGDVNSETVQDCGECGTARRAKTQPRFEAQPVSPGLIWLATFLGGAFAGLVLAIWNGRLLSRKRFPLLAVYGVLAILGWLVTVYCLKTYTGEYISRYLSVGPLHVFLPLPAWGIGFGLTIGFLLAAIPYNRDALPALQWQWAHPVRKPVLAITGGSIPGLRFTYVSFVEAEGELFARSEPTPIRAAIPILPVVVAISSAIIGIATLVIAAILG